MSYFDRLRALSRERNTLLCVGLDPDPERIDGGATGALRHCRGIVHQTEEHACCFKPNSAFWEQYGPDGWQALLELREEAPTTPFLFDAKRGDMGNTMRAYALAAFKTLGMARSVFQSRRISVSAGRTSAPIKTSSRQFSARSNFASLPSWPIEIQ